MLAWNTQKPNFGWVLNMFIFFMNFDVLYKDE